MTQRVRNGCAGVGKALAAVLLLWTTGCATNPVTGRREMRFISESSEIQMGEQAYGEQQQAQGGPYTAHPEVTAYVQSVVDKLVKVSDRPELPYEVTILNNSVPNAWALPGGKMAVNRGLLPELKSEAELAAVMGHEIVHVAAGHGAQSVQRGMGTQLVLTGLGLAIKDRDYSDLILAGSGVSAALVNFKFGRSAELESDLYGIKYMVKAGYDPQAAVTLQETFLRLADGKDPGWLVGLLSTHPPSKERVEENRKTCAKYPAGGFVGEAEYAKAIAPLKKAATAYDDLEKGYKALEKKQPAAALGFAESAIRVEPAEAHFYGLAAKAYGEQKKYERALQALNQAITLNDRYFEFYLLRGKLKQGLGDTAGAKADLQRSTSLMPTATAHYQLGLIDLNAGSQKSALRHLELAAGSNSPDGRQADATLAKLVMAKQPQKYLELRADVNPRGLVRVTIVNRSPLEVNACSVSVLSPETGRWESYAAPRAIPAGRSVDVQTKVGPITSREQAGKVRVRIDSVSVSD